MLHIPNYEIGKLAGRGGVAEVYLARHVLLDRQVAIKLISPAHADDLADKRFLKEAKVVAGLRHPNIVSIYDVGVYENKYYIIMEYLEGGDLKQSIKRSLPVSQTLKIMRQIASALAHAHDKGFIHRDIKSQNIMFRVDGTAVLTDFGIVKDLASDTGYTMVGTSIGTPSYMSPEQAQGADGIDWRTDLYSLGVTFYEMLTGSVPYTADSAVAVALKHIKDPVPELPKNLSRFQPIISKLMAKDPNDRYQSAHDLIHAIDTIEKADIEEESPTYASLQPRKSAPRISIANILLGVVIGCVLFGLALFIQQYLSGLKDREPGNVETARKFGEKETKQPFFDFRKKSEPESGMEQLTRFLEKKAYPEALQVISSARKDIAEPPIEMVRKGDALLGKKQYLNAGDIFNTVLSVDPQNRLALLGLLHAAIAMHQDISAKEGVTENEYALLLSLLDKGIENTRSGPLEYLKTAATQSVFETAGRYLKNKQFKEAERWAKTGLKYAPDHLRLKKLAYFIKAGERFDEDRLISPEQDNALFYYQKILEMDSGDAAAKQGIAEVADRCKTMAGKAWKEKKYAEALQWMEKARSAAPNDATLQVSEWLLKADKLAADGSFTSPENENALYYYRKVLAQDPSNKQAILGVASMDVMTQLHQVRRKAPLSEKIPAYEALFDYLRAAVNAHGDRDMADVKRQVMDQVKNEMAYQKKQKKPIPAEFLSLVSRYFPDEPQMFTSPYDILIAKGDESTSRQEKADYYLKALKQNPDASAAKSRIEKMAGSLAESGKTEEASTLLERAMDIVPEHGAFHDRLMNIKKLQDIQSEISPLMAEIKQSKDVLEKMDAYTALFENQKAFARKYGSKKITPLMKEVKAQVKADIQSRKRSGRLIPEEFMTIVRKYLPELDNHAINAQYDILVGLGDKTASKREKADYYLNALDLDKNREDAQNRIVRLAESLVKDGDSGAASALLEEARRMAPNDLILGAVSGNMQSNVEVFATATGCNKGNLIHRAIASVETLTVCINYKNLQPDSVVMVVLSHKGGKALEVPVILDGRSGSKPIDIEAPLEGFSVGEYVISVRQNKKVLTETTIQLIPKRR